MRTSFAIAPSATLAPRPLPRPNRRLTALATALTHAARGLLPMPGEMFLAVTLESATLLRVTWLRRDLQPCAEIISEFSHFCPETSAEGAFQRAAVELLAWLKGRWPREAAPAALGVLCDGTGVAVSPQHPSPAASGWMVRHAAGAAELFTILPLANGGPCALLCAPRETTGIH